mmetsp:Transcript_52262/g.111967  ORF Transcript_52262/g.111967 Transcript_52262/m.111967 type:complete len:248 (+) Transcript_52262:3-746(+)
MTPSMDLFCGSGKWIVGSCDKYCGSPGIVDAVDSSCQSTLPGEFCPLSCGEGYETTGDLLCTGHGWLRASCVLQGTSLSGEVVQSMKIAGVALYTENSRWMASIVIRGVISTFLHVPDKWITVSVERSTELGVQRPMEVLPLSTTRPDISQQDWEPQIPYDQSPELPQRRQLSSATRVTTKVLCDQCADLQMRMRYVFLNTRRLERAFARALCNARCEDEASCTSSCPERDMQVMYVDNPVVKPGAM